MLTDNQSDAVKSKKDKKQKKKVLRIILGGFSLLLLVGIICILKVILTPDAVRVERYLEKKYGIEFVVDDIHDHRNRDYSAYDNLYFCHPVEDDSIQFCVYEAVGGELEDKFIEQAVVRELEQNIKSDFEELGIDVTLECTVESYEEMAPWINEDYQITLEEFLSTYDNKVFQIYAIIRKEDIVDADGNPNLELISELVLKYSEDTSTNVCFQMLFASDEMYEQFEDVFTACPMVTHYKGYGFDQTDQYAVIMVVLEGEFTREIDGYYKDYYWRKDWEDKIILKE